jgi:hypothetical protein
MQHHLHVEREEEEHRQEAGHCGHLRGVGDGDSPDAEDRQRDAPIPGTKRVSRSLLA